MREPLDQDGARTKSYRLLLTGVAFVDLVIGFLIIASLDGLARYLVAGGLAIVTLVYVAVVIPLTNRGMPTEERSRWAMPVGSVIFLVLLFFAVLGGFFWSCQQAFSGY
jgi:hypothetical protein